MFEAKVGSSVLADAKAAGVEAASAAASADAKVAFVYCDCNYDVDAVVAGVSEALPGVAVLGNTSFGSVITADGNIGDGTPFVGVMTFCGDELAVGVAGVDRAGVECPVTAGADIAKAAIAAAGKDAAPEYFYMAASPAEEEFYLKGISSVVGRIPFFGGSAADNTIAGEWKLYYGGAPAFADGCVVAFFYGAPTMTNVFTGAYRETDDFGVITKVANNRALVEIDGMPARDKYQEWMGVDDEAVTEGNLLVTSITSPLGVKDRLGDLIAIRHPMNGNADKSIACGNNLAEKTCVIRMEATVDELIASVPNTIEALKAKMPGEPVAFHLVHCGGRKAGIGDRVGEVVEAAQAACGDVPFIVEFTFGEYGFESDNNNTCGGLMLSFTGFSA